MTVETDRPIDTRRLSTGLAMAADALRDASATCDRDELLEALESAAGWVVYASGADEGRFDRAAAALNATEPNG